MRYQCFERWILVLGLRLGKVIGMQWMGLGIKPGILLSLQGIETKQRLDLGLSSSGPRWGSLTSHVFMKILLCVCLKKYVCIVNVCVKCVWRRDVCVSQDVWLKFYALKTKGGGLDRERWRREWMKESVVLERKRKGQGSNRHLRQRERESRQTDWKLKVTYLRYSRFFASFTADCHSVHHSTQSQTHDRFYQFNLHANCCLVWRWEVVERQMMW